MLFEHLTKIVEAIKPCNAHDFDIFKCPASDNPSLC